MFLERNQEVTEVPKPPVLQSALPQQAPCDLQRSAAGGRLPLKPHASPRVEQGIPRSEESRGRCCEKGCVFPALPGGGGECAYHRREILEPACFSSQQPTRLLLDHARFSLPYFDAEDTRSRDRRRLAAERVRSMLEEGAW